MKPMKHWTKEKCQEEALKYTKRTDFKNNSGSAYVTASRNGWIEDICSHMRVIGNLKKRCIYVYEFPDNSAYVGLTYDIEDRKQRHSTDTRSSVFIHIKEKNIQPCIKQLTDYLEINEAKKNEKVYVEKYKNEGWNILNKIMAGGVGSNIKIWTKEKCQEEALKYETRKKFQKGSGSAYNSAFANKWLDEICNHMTELLKPKGYWTLERCREEAQKFNKKIDFKNNSSGCYTVAYQNNWFEEICRHMKKRNIKKNSKNS